jgi:HTH-type transcriptional regulator / antitoxin HigA
MTTMTKSKKTLYGIRRRAKIAGVAEDYLDLVRRFPLRPLRVRDEYIRAGEVLQDLLGRADDPGLSPGETDYTDVLVRLVRDYDERHSSLLKDRAARRKPSPIEALRWLMEEHQMNTIGLGKLVGGSGQASLILNGKRELSKANIRTLAKHFSVSPALFI